jgi:putative ABC transport system substrate-binding protein
MNTRLKRREFITLLGASAVWPGVARAQQRPAMPVVGYFNSGTPELTAGTLAAFRSGLGETGFVESRNVAFEYRWAHNDPARLPELAADLVRRRVTVIAALNGSSALAAKAATTTIPIVFFAASDAVEIGLVTNLSRPDGNLTGFNSMSVELEAKRLGLLHELLPQARRLGMLADPNVPGFESIVASVQAAATTIGQPLDVLTASTNGEIDAAFARIAEKQVDGLLVTTAGLFSSRRVQIATLAARYAVPTIVTDRSSAEAGGLMSYAPNGTDQYRQVGIYAGRVLKGEKPADLPVMQPVKFEFVITCRRRGCCASQSPPRCSPSPTR